MRPFFRPFPGLTIFTIISLIILICLGKWQGNRLVWKTNLLVEIEEAATAPPLTSLADVETRLAEGRPVDFRRFGAEVNIGGNRPEFHRYTSEGRQIGWRRYVPVTQGNISVFAALDIIADTDKTATKTLPLQKKWVSGYVRLWRPRARGQVKSTPSENRWFGFDPQQDTAPWVDALPVGGTTVFYIDAVSGVTDSATLPVRRPDIRNNHFDYMLTWYGLAVCLLIVYILLHRQHGRLGLRRDAT